MKKTTTICLMDWLNFLEGGVERSKKVKNLLHKEKTQKRDEVAFEF